LHTVEFLQARKLAVKSIVWDRCSFPHNLDEGSI